MPRFGSKCVRAELTHRPTEPLRDVRRSGPAAGLTGCAGTAGGRLAKEWTQFLSLSSAHREECEHISRASGSGWWRVNKGQIPSFVPATMQPKLDGGVWVVSGSSSGVTYLMFGAERVDRPADARDIQPFGIAVFPSGASTGMALIHHGGWIDRSVRLPDGFGSLASSCSTGSYFFARPPEGKSSGSLEDLGPGHKAAFQRILSSLSRPSTGGAA